MAIEVAYQLEAGEVLAADDLTASFIRYAAPSLNLRVQHRLVLIPRSPWRTVCVLPCLSSGVHSSSALGL